MKPYNQLTKRGMATRLRYLAYKALESYPLEIKDLHLIGMFTNTLFRVCVDNGSSGKKSFIIRICRPGWRTEQDLRSEIVWLLALSRCTDICAPIPQSTRDGDFYVEVSAAGVPGSRRCVLMSWLPGSLLGKRLNKRNLFLLGELFAKLHLHAEKFIPTQGFTTKKMDGIFARGEQDVLFSEPNLDAFNNETWAIFNRVRKVVDDAFVHLYANPTGMRVIHNDLWHNNVKVFRGELHPFDFEDTIWGYPVQDIAMAWQDLMTDVDVQDFDPLINAFKEGYESLYTWPETYDGQIDKFRAGRVFWVVNYVARYEREHLQSVIERVAAVFEKFLVTGKLRKISNI